MNAIRVEEHRDGVQMTFPAGLHVRFAKDGDRAFGIADVRLGDVAFRNPGRPIRPLFCTTGGGDYVACRYLGYETQADRVVVHTRLKRRQGGEDELNWILAAKQIEIGGTAYSGLSYCYHFVSEDDAVDELIDRTTWELGGRSHGNVVTRYNSTNLPESVIDDETDCFAVEWGRFINRQCFDYQWNETGGLLVFFEDVRLINSGVFCAKGSPAIHHIDAIHYPRSRELTTPAKHVVFSRCHGLDEWANIRDGLQDMYRERVGVRAETPQPTLNVSREFYWNNPEASFERVAREVLHEADRLGFKRIYVGPIWWDGKERSGGCSVPELEVRQFGGEPGLRSLCNEAHARGVEIMAWAPAGYLAGDSPLIAEHPDWIVEDESAYEHLLCASYRTGYKDYFLERLRAIRAATGLDALWLDSFTHAFEAVAPDSRQDQVAEVLELVRRLQECGYTIYTEGMSPFGVFAAEMHLMHLAAERGHEHYAYNTSRYYIGPPNALDFPGRVPLERVDYFRYYANKAAMILEYDRIMEHPGLDERLRELNRRYAQVVDMMERRHLLEDGRGVEWRNSRSDDVVVFAFNAFPYNATNERTILEVRADGPVRLGTGSFDAEPGRVYWIREYHSGD